MKTLISSLASQSKPLNYAHVTRFSFLMHVRFYFSLQGKIFSFPGIFVIRLPCGLISSDDLWYNLTHSRSTYGYEFALNNNYRTNNIQLIYASLHVLLLCFCNIAISTCNQSAYGVLHVWPTFSVVQLWNEKTNLWFIASQTNLVMGVKRFIFRYKTFTCVEIDFKVQSCKRAPYESQYRSLSDAIQVPEKIFYN